MILFLLPVSSSSSSSLPFSSFFSPENFQELFQAPGSHLLSSLSSRLLLLCREKWKDCPLSPGKWSSGLGTVFLKTVTMASTRLEGRAPSEPGFEIQGEVPLFSFQFHHFWTLSATDDQLDCLNQTLRCPFMKKKPGPVELESGTESKKKRLYGLA